MSDERHRSGAARARAAARALRRTPCSRRTQYRGDATAQIDPARAGRRLHASCATTRRSRFDLLVDVTAVDYLGSVPRFEVVYHLYSLAQHHRLRLKARVPEDDPRIAER